MYPQSIFLSKNIKNIIFSNEIFIFLILKNILCILHGHVFVMAHPYSQHTFDNVTIAKRVCVQNSRKIAEHSLVKTGSNRAMIKHQHCSS